MGRSLVFRAVITGLAFVVGFGLAYGVFEVLRLEAADSTGETALPDPLARRATPASSWLFIGLLVVVASGTLWLGRRRIQEPEDEPIPKPSGPHLIFERTVQGRKRPPEFYETLRNRETILESQEAKGPERMPRKVIELPVSRRPRVQGNGESRR